MASSLQNRHNCFAYFRRAEQRRKLGEREMRVMSEGKNTGEKPGERETRVMREGENTKNFCVLPLAHESHFALASICLKYAKKIMPALQAKSLHPTKTGISSVPNEPIDLYSDLLELI